VAANDIVKLRVRSGVPILEVQGEWLPDMTESVIRLIRSLAEAGHYEIVLNVQQAGHSALGALESLSGAVQGALALRPPHGGRNCRADPRAPGSLLGGRVRDYDVGGTGHREDQANPGVDCRSFVDGLGAGDRLIFYISGLRTVETQDRAERTVRCNTKRIRA
jgi:hypothetical protein